jgi:hypothetical protein
MGLLDFLSGLASIATALGVGVAAFHLRAAQKQGRTSFEDSLNSQYRSVIRCLPLDALFGRSISAEDLSNFLPCFYQYFDLCNEQIFLHRIGRISEQTWKNWEEGITGNLRRPAFSDAWALVAAGAKDDFELLRKLCPPPGVSAADIVAP